MRWLYLPNKIAQVAKRVGIVGFEVNIDFLLNTDIVKSGTTLATIKTRDVTLPILALTKHKGWAASALMLRLPACFTASDRLQSFPTQPSRELLKNAYR